MKKYVFFTTALLPLIMALTTAPTAICGEPETEFHYTNAMGNYRSGNYKAALKDVKDYIAADPENRAKKQFAVKLLLKMATNSHLEKREAQALEYLKTARSYEDNEQVNDLYLSVEAALNPSPEAESQETAHTFDISSRDGFSLDNWPSRPEPAAPVIKKPEGTDPPPVKPKSARQLPAASLQPDIPRAKLPTADTGRLPAPERSRVKAAPAALSVPAESVNIFLKAAIIVSALIVFFAGAAFLYLRRIHNRLLLDSSAKAQDAWQDLQEEKTRIKEERERLARSLEEKIAREREKLEIAEKRRQEDWDWKERERQEAWKKAERARLRTEALQKRTSDDKATEKERVVNPEEPPSKTLKSEKEISEKLLVADAQEAVRKLKYKNLAARLLAYKRFASQLKGIYELNKENAMDSIKPLLNNSDPRVRAYLAGGLSQLPIPEFAVLLLRLWNDSDANVRGESLRGLLSFYRRQDFASVFPEPIQVRIKQLVELEKSRNEWVF